MTRKYLALICMTLSAAVAAAPVEVRFEAADGVVVYGDLTTADVGKAAPIVLLFHQAGGDARGEYGPIAGRLVASGYNVLAIDQRNGGERFGGVNRTLAGLDGEDYDYCAVYPDLEAALAFARSQGFSGKLAVWGSSYSAALVFQLGARNPGQVDAVLGFSPASGPPLAECDLAPWLQDLQVPALALRPEREAAIESVQAQLRLFESHDIAVHVARPGVHGSSMLVEERVGATTEASWQVVLEFLEDALGGD